MRILFVCTGNTCRSPMAEAFLRELSVERGLRLEVRSAGVSTVDGLPVSRHALQVLENNGIAHKGASTPASESLLEWADLVLTMTSSHKQALLRYWPGASGKVHTLKEYASPGQDGAAGELDRHYSERMIAQSLGRRPDDSVERRIRELEQQLPLPDIADPYGGSYEDYARCAEEIREALSSLLERPEFQSGSSERNEG